MPTTSMPDVLADVGLTYRQIDYLVRRGLLHPEHGGGIGKPRKWPERELRVARLIADLREAGVEMEPAAKAAREAVETPVAQFAHSVTVDLGDGIRLVVRRT